MFWNSINRKQKVDTTTEKDIPAVVAIHNNMNETTWRKVMEWEEVQGYKDGKLEKVSGKGGEMVFLGDVKVEGREKRKGSNEGTTFNIDFLTSHP